MISEEHKEEVLEDYQERVAIGVYEGQTRAAEAEQQARIQVYEELESIGYSRQDSVYALHKILKGERIC